MKKLIVALFIIVMLYGAWTYLVIFDKVEAYSFSANILKNISISKVVTPTPIVTQPVKIKVDPLLKSYAFEKDYGDISQSFPIENENLEYVNTFVELPLLEENYYWGKYENAKAGVNSLNKISILKPGDKKSLITDNIINIEKENGYIQPQYGYYFGSGLCWSTSALGYLMDKANIEFNQKYGVDLFVFKSGDRSPHSSYYKTYQLANNGYGYSILQASERVPVLEYTFTINPELADIEELKDLELKIVMLATDNYSNSSHGQSIAGYIASNKDF